MSSKPIWQNLIRCRSDSLSQQALSLLSAVHAGDVAYVRQAVTDSPELLACGFPGDRTLLMIACEQGCTELVEFLVTQLDRFGINAVNEGGDTALYLAAKYQYHAIAALLMEAGATSCPVLWQAVKKNNRSVIDFFAQ
jgi:ankyrin repeat protein